MISTHTYFGSSYVKLTWLRKFKPLDNRAVTSIHALCFYEGRMVIVDLDHRGWDIPGGHLENGETSETCIKREAMEEAYISGTFAFLGSIEVNHSDDPAWTPAHKYPKIGYQLYYRMEVEDIHPFIGDFESSRRAFIPPGEAPLYIDGWHEVLEEILYDSRQIS